MKKVKSPLIIFDTLHINFTFIWLWWWPKRSYGRVNPTKKTGYLLHYF